MEKENLCIRFLLSFVIFYNLMRSFKYVWHKRFNLKETFVFRKSFLRDKGKGHGYATITFLFGVKKLPLSILSVRDWRELCRGCKLELLKMSSWGVASVWRFHHLWVLRLRVENMLRTLTFFFGVKKHPLLILSVRDLRELCRGRELELLKM